MLKRMLSLLIVILMLPVFALADNTPEYQVFTFTESLPAKLIDPLAGYIPTDARILSGAAIQHNGGYIEPDEPSSWDSYSSMMLVDTADGLQLFAAAWVDGLPWQVNDFTHLLRADRNVSISVYQPEPNRIPQFSVDYVVAGSVVSDLMIFRGNRLWCVDGHTNEAAGTHISVGLGTATVIDAQGRVDTLCLEYFWLDYMTNIYDLPTSREQVLALESAAHATLSANEAQKISYTTGANLRQNPTANSASLGLYNTNVPLTLTGQQAPGASYPWYEVRIGNTVGWMSGNYVYPLPSQYYPVPLGRTVDICPLYAAIGDTQPVMQLSPGATFHILTEIDGLYHICVPQDDISWEVDRNGVYGYIPKDNILTGYSPSALDAQSTR